MEMLEGRSLTELLARERPSVARSVGIVRQVCSALQAAHDVGVIHRDVKPDNLFVLERDGRDFVKVLDFGVAKLATPLGGDLPLTTTVEGTIVGTPAYMAPEQATGGSADPRTDLYAVGVVLYELLTGHPPFQAPAFGQLVAQVLTAPPPPLPAHTPAGDRIPSALAAVVRRALAKDPADRYPSLDALSAALEDAERTHRSAAARAVGAGGRSAGGGCGRRRASSSGPGGATHRLGTPDRRWRPWLPGVTRAGAGRRRGLGGTVPLIVASTPSGARVVDATTGRGAGNHPLRQQRRPLERPRGGCAWSIRATTRRSWTSCPTPSDRCRSRWSAPKRRPIAPATAVSDRPKAARRRRIPTRSSSERPGSGAGGGTPRRAAEPLSASSGAADGSVGCGGDVLPTGGLAEQEHQHEREGEQRCQDQEAAVEGADQRLGVEPAGHQRVGALAGVGEPPHHPLRLGELLLEEWVVGVGVAGQVGPELVAAVGEHGAHPRRADGAAQLAGHVEEAGGAAALPGAEAGERHHRERDEAEAQRQRADEERHGQRVGVGQLGQVPVHPQRGHQPHDPRPHHQAGCRPCRSTGRPAA